MIQTLRPLSIGELLDRTFHYYRAHFTLFLGIAALPGLLTLAFRMLALLVQPASLGPGTILMWAVASIFVGLVATTLSQGATMIAVSQIQLGRETNAAEAFNRIRPRLGELVMLTVNVGIRVALALLLLIVPGILLGLKYSLAVPVAVLEDAGISESIERSGVLTQGHRGRIFVIYGLLFLLAMVVSSAWQTVAMMAISAATGQVQPNLLPLWARAVLDFGAFATQTLIGPVMTIALALVYYDERIRKEAFDLEHMMRQLDGPASSPSPLS